LSDLGELVGELLIEPNPVLGINVEPIMRVAPTGAVVERKRSTADREGPEGVLERVIQPDQALLVDADTGCVRATRSAGGCIEILGYTAVCSRLCGSRIEHADGTGKTLRPPDVAVLICRDQVGGEAGSCCWGISYLVLVQHTLGCVLSDQGHGIGIFGKPDVVGGVHRNAIWVTVGCRSRDFVKRP
jgi:hypothetical protein